MSTMLAFLGTGVVAALTAINPPAPIHFIWPWPRFNAPLFFYDPAAQWQMAFDWGPGLRALPAAPFLAAENHQLQPPTC